MLKALIGLAAICLLVSFNVNAQVVSCNTAASDSDGDGWGWENGASCVVTSPQSPPSLSGFCASASSDADGDGWGWENGASCQVSSNPPPVQQPGQPQQRNLIADFSGSVVGTEAGTHSFTLTDPASVSITGLDSYNFELLLFDTNGNLIWQDSYWYANQCLTAGSYTVQINQYSTYSLEPQNYAISIYGQDTSCVAPSTTVNLGFSDYYALVTSNGTVLTTSYEDNQGVTAYDRYGSRLWSVPDAAFLDAAESNTDGSTIIAYSTYSGPSRVAVVERNGNVRWTQDINSYVYGISVNNNTAALSSDVTLISVDLNNGTINFQYENQNQYSPSIPRVLDDGTIITTVIDQNGSVQILTFD